MKTVSSKYLAQVVLENDVPAVLEILDEFGLPEGEIPTIGVTELLPLQNILGLAAAMSDGGRLTDDLARNLVERFALGINLFSFLRLVTVSKNIKAKNYDAIPRKLRKELRRAEYNDEMVEEIKQMIYQPEVFSTLIAYLASGDEVESIDRRFSLPIVQRIYQTKLIPDGTLLSYLGLCLTASMSIQMSDIAEALNGGILACFGMLDDDCFGMLDDDEHGQHDCREGDSEVSTR